MPESRRSLSREAFAEAAVAFVDEHGFDALTMRALGDAMGVHATAVYRYFSGKDELVEAALGAMLAESGVVIPEQGTPRERLLETMRSLRSAFARHPNFALPNLLLQDEQATIGIVDAALALLSEMGLRGHHMVVAYQMLETFSVGSNAYDFAGYPETLDARRRGRRLTGNPVWDDVTRDLERMRALNDEAFEVAAGALLDACEAMASATS